jgi:hypothetical protein
MRIRFSVLTIITGALLTACPTEPPSNPALGLTPTVSGKIAGWNNGVKAIQLEYGGFNTIPPINAGNIAADGSFSVTLPQLPAEKVNVVKKPDCTTGTASITPQTLATGKMYLTYLPNPQDLNTISSITQSQASSNPNPQVGQKFVAVYREYSTVDGTVTYNNCVTGSFILKGTLNYKVGWNEVHLESEVLTVSNNQTTSLGLTYSNGSKNRPWGVLTETSTRTAF